MTYLINALSDGKFEIIDSDFAHLYPDLDLTKMPVLTDEQYQEYCSKNNSLTQWIDGAFVYQSIVIDKDAMLKRQQAQVWEQIKQKRYQNCRSGVYVKSVDKWFHSDDASRQQYVFMRTLSEFPLTHWKTMDNSFVEMTKDLLNELSLAMFTHEQADFANAEKHRLAMLSVDNPLDYDYSTGWQEVFNG